MAIQLPFKKRFIKKLFFISLIALMFFGITKIQRTMFDSSVAKMSSYQQASKPPSKPNSEKTDQDRQNQHVSITLTELLDCATSKNLKVYKEKMLAFSMRYNDDKNSVSNSEVLNELNACLK